MRPLPPLQLLLLDVVEVCDVDISPSMIDVVVVVVAAVVTCRWFNSSFKWLEGETDCWLCCASEAIKAAELRAGAAAAVVVEGEVELRSHSKGISNAAQ